MAFREREVAFYSDGSKIAAMLFTPAEQQRPGPGVVLCQGLNGVGVTYRFPQTARAFAAAGYTSLIFDYRGFGASEGQANRLWPQEQLDDVCNALTFLAGQSEVDSQRLALWGTSFGGAHVVQAAAVDLRVRCLVSVVGIGNGERWIRQLWPYWRWRELSRRLEEDRRRRVLEGRSAVVERDELLALDPDSEAARRRHLDLSPDAKESYPPLRITLESAEKILAYRPEETISRVSPRPIMLIHTLDDVLVPPDESRAMYERAGERKKLVLLPGHHFSVYEPPLYDQVTQLSLDWFRQHLPV